VTADCGTGADAAVFVVVAGRAPIHVGGDEGPIACLAEGLANAIQPPFRAVGVRQDGAAWAVGAVSIEVAELPADTEGEELMLTVTEGERALEVDGRPSALPIPALEDVAGGRYDAYFLRATRLDERLWEIGLDPL
jgi:hypothetical protein